MNFVEIQIHFQNEMVRSLAIGFLWKNVGPNWNFWIISL